MTAIVSVLSGSSVVQSLVLQPAATGGAPRIRASAGGRFVLAGAENGVVAEGIAVKRMGKNLLLTEESEGSEHHALIIEDFFANQAQLFALGADGKYQPYLAAVAGAAPTPELDQGSLPLLQLASTSATAVQASSLFGEGGSAALSAVAIAPLLPAGAMSRVSELEPVGAVSAIPVAATLAAEPQPAVPVMAVASASMAGPSDHDVLAEPEVTVASTHTVVDVLMESVTVIAEPRADKVPAMIISDVVGPEKTALAVAFDASREAAIDTMLDDQGAIQGNIQNGGFTDDGRPQMVGKAASGVLVHIYNGTELIGQVVAGSGGDWSFVPRLPLADGRHVISVIYEYPDGDVSDISAPYVIFVDKVVPDVPLILGMKDDQGRIQGQIVNGSVTDDNRPTIDGSAEAYATVIIYDKGMEIGRVPVDADGKWSYTPSVGLEDGLHILDYAVVDRAGNGSEKSSATQFHIDTRPELVEIYAAEDDIGTVKGTFMSGGVTDDTQPRLFGTATAGGTVKIYEGSVLLGQVTAGVDGKWEFTPPIGLTEGSHSLAATVSTVAKGESDRSATFDFTIDVTAPDKPTIDQVYDDRGLSQGALSHGQSTDDTTPTLSGKAEAGSTVRVYDNGIELGTTVADAAGKWSFTPSPALDDGEHVFTVTAQDKAGSVSDASDGFAIVIDTIPPSAPVIVSVYDDQGSLTGFLNSGGVTDDAKPTIRGSAEANAIVVIRDHGLEIGRTKADANGEWEFEPFLPMGLGLHKLTAEAIDAAGNTSVLSNRFDLTLEGPDRPAAPAITSVVDDVGSVTGNLQKNDVTDDARPTINGTAQAGMTVSVYIDGTLSGSAVVGMTGEWSYTPPTDLADGPHSITAKASNSVGNVSDPTGEYPIVVDTTPPVAPTADDAALWDDAGQITGQISNGTVTDDNTPSFVGKAEPNASVVIYDGNTVIGCATTNDSGDWSFTPSPALADGPHMFSYEVVDKAGNVGPKSETIDFHVDTSRLEVTIEGATDDVGKITGAISKGGVTDDTTPTLHGKATAGGIVKIFEGDVLLGQVVAGSDKSWSFTPPLDLVSGPHNLTATVTTIVNGESARSSGFDFSIDVTAPDTPTIDKVVDDVGALQGALLKGQSTDDSTPTLSGKAEAGSTVHIYDKGSLLGSVVAGAGGDWSFTPNPPLLNGEHEFTVKAEDQAGNVSPSSEVFDIVIDTVAPDKPVIESVYDDQGARTGNVAAGGITDDATPSISGRAEAGCVVIVKDGEVELGRVLAGTDGKWTLELSVALSDGEHVLSVEALDAAGNLSVPSDGFAFSVDTSVPTAPKISNIRDDVGSYIGLLLNGGSTDDSKPTINGNGKAGELIEVRSGDVLLGSTIVAENGRWSFTPDAALPDGVHTFSAIAISSGGAESMVSNLYAVRVDTVAPDRPIIDAVQDNVGPWTGDLQNGQTTDDRTPTFVGRAEPSSTILVFNGGEEVGFATVDEDGSWTYAAERLAYGEHRFTFQAFDVAGNLSDASEEWVVVVAMASRSMPIDTDGEVPVLAQDLLVEGHVEFFVQDAAQTGVAVGPAALADLHGGVELATQESWIVRADDAVGGSWSSPNSIELNHTLDQQLVG